MHILWFWRFCGATNTSSGSIMIIWMGSKENIFTYPTSRRCGPARTGFNGKRFRGTWYDTSSTTDWTNFQVKAKRFLWFYTLHSWVKRIFEREIRGIRFWGVEGCQILIQSQQPEIPASSSCTFRLTISMTEISRRNATVTFAHRRAMGLPQRVGA